MEKDENKMPEIVIPQGFELDEVLDFDDSDFGEERPICIEEVRLRRRTDFDGGGEIAF